MANDFNLFILWNKSVFFQYFKRFCFFQLHLKKKTNSECTKKYRWFNLTNIEFQCCSLFENIYTFALDIIDSLIESPKIVCENALNETPIRCGHPQIINQKICFKLTNRNNHFFCVWKQNCGCAFATNEHNHKLYKCIKHHLTKYTK